MSLARLPRGSRAKPPGGTVWRWLDSLFARMLLVQATVVVMVVVLFVVFSIYKQSQSQARAMAPLWAAALAPVLAGRSGLPSVQPVATSVRLVPGPLPADATQFPFYQRLYTLAVELRAAGVPVRSARVSGSSGDSITWLLIDRGGHADWIGVQSALEGTDLRWRGAAALLIGTLGTLAAAWWLSRRVVLPLAELRQAMRRFAADGQPPGPARPGASRELRELTQQFADLARERQAAEAQRRTMLAAISHDLRSPLGRIRLAAELLPDAPGVDQRRSSIVRNVALADRLLGSFIELARAEDGPLTERVDLVALVAAVLADLARSEPALVPGALPDQPLWLQPASASALERALRNLLDNACHHGAGPIALALVRDGPTAVLSVRDHGPGIAPADRAPLLQAFARGDSSRNTPGTGLGLFIVQRTAQRHGGTLTLHDAAPGLRAELRLPVAPLAA